MVYEDYNHPQVIKLRRFRDDFLLKNLIGVLFVNLYYKYSPSFVKRMKGHHSINIVFKKILDTIIYFIKLIQKIFEISNMEILYQKNVGIRTVMLSKNVKIFKQKNMKSSKRK